MKTLYQIIEDGIRNQVPSIVVSDNYTEHDVYMAVRSVMRDHPDIFWFSHQWKYSRKAHSVSLWYSLSKERVKKAKMQISDVVKRDFRLDHARFLPKREQLMYIYKWLAKYCGYNIYSAFNQSILSVFVNRNSVCTGYAKAAQFLLQLLGIESKLVFGHLNNSEEGSRHCWLVVKVDDVWYHYDPTFAVPETRDILIKTGVKPIVVDDGLIYNYFCTDTATISESRSIEEFESLPLCNQIMDIAPLMDLYVKSFRSTSDERQAIGCLLADHGTTADIYLYHDEDEKDREEQWVVKVFKGEIGRRASKKELYVANKVKGPHLLRCQMTTGEVGMLKVEQATPIPELLCCNYYQLTASRFCQLLDDVLKGLKECLDCGFFFCDIHLNNIYRSKDGTYKLGDFGSCLDVNGTLNKEDGIGSPWYLAPEAYMYREFDETSLVYGVAMIAYYLLNDLCPPFWKEKGNNANEVRMRGEKIRMPNRLVRMDNDFARNFAVVLEKALSFERGQRYQHLDELEKGLDRLLEIAYQNDFIILEGGSAGLVGDKMPFSLTNESGKTDFSSTSFNGVSYERDDDLDGLAISERVNDFDSTGVVDHCSISMAEPCPIPVSERVNDFASTASGPEPRMAPRDVTYEPIINGRQTSAISPPKAAKQSIWKRLFGSKKKQQTHIDRIPQEDSVYASVFSPSQVKERSHMLIQVFLHLEYESDKVTLLASEADRNAQRRGYEPLKCKLKQGEQIDIELKIFGEQLLKQERRTVIWRGIYTKCSFDYLIPQNLGLDDLSCEITIYRSGVPIGDLRFLTMIVENPRNLNAEVKTRQYNKIFISYSHKDSDRVKSLALAYKAQGTDYFYDRDNLMAGDVYEEKILRYIDKADLFILCWSENASKSEYVQKERARAMLHAYPFKKMCDATLRIYPISIEPRAELPSDMSGIYNFEEI